MPQQFLGISRPYLKTAYFFNETITLIPWHRFEATLGNELL